MLRTNPSLLAKPDKEHVLLLMPFFAEASSRLGHSATRWRFSSNYFKCLGDYLFLLKHKNGIPISKETLSLEWAKYLKAVPLQFWAFVHLFASLVNLYKRGFEITFLLQLLCLVFIFNLNNSGWKLQTINPCYLNWLQPVHVDQLRQQSPLVPTSQRTQKSQQWNNSTAGSVMTITNQWHLRFWKNCFVILKRISL